MKLIIFDIDGTLLYSNKIDSQCFADTYQKIYNKPFPTIDWSTYPHVSDHTIFNTVIKTQFDRLPSLEEVHHFQDHFVAMIEERRIQNPQDFLEVPGAKSTVEKLLANDEYAIGIGTGGWQRPAMVKLAHVQIPTEDLFISCADGKVSRDDILQESIDLAKAQHAAFEKIVYVGDAPWDVKTTRNMNLDFVGIRRNGDHDILLKLGAQKVLGNYLDFDLFMETVESAVPPA